MVKEAEGPISLDVVRAGKFFRRLADDPFLAIVVDDEGEVSIFIKGLDSAHYDRIKGILRAIVEDRE